jgi:hypothetical protein
MRRFRACALLVLTPTLVIAAAGCGHQASDQGAAAPSPAPATAPAASAAAAPSPAPAGTPGTSSPPCTASSTWLNASNPPLDVSIGNPNPFCPFQQFSWQSFLFLMQPASGGPLNSQTLMPEEGVFVADGQKPLPWGQKVTIPASCKAPPQVTLYLGQIDNTADSGIFEAETGTPIVDQRGRWVHYGVHLNRAMYNYLLSCNLWQTACFNQFGASVSFTSGPPVAQNSIEAKTAWRVMETCKLPDSPKEGCKPDNLANFYTTLAAVQPYSAADPSCHTMIVGLVGMHVVSKTPSHPEFIWSSFENLTNDPACTNGAPPPPGGWSFNNPGCTGSNCATNTYFNPCAPPANTFDPSCTKPNISTQVCAQNPTGGDNTGDIQSVNANVAAMLPAGSTWKNYYLVGTEWTTNGDKNPPAQVGSVSLANSTAETYAQGPIGCFNCHQNTFTPSTGNAPQADFSHLFGSLQTTSTTCTPPPGCKLTAAPPSPQLLAPTQRARPFRLRHQISKEGTPAPAKH